MIEIIRSYIISLPRSSKTLISLFADLFTLNLSIISSSVVFFLNEKGYFSYELFPLLKVISEIDFFIIILINLFSIFIILSLDGYKSFFRSSEISKLVGVARLFSIIFYSITIFATIYLQEKSFYTAFRVSLSNLVYVFFFITIFRTIIFEFLINKSDESTIPLVIYGAGQAGRETAAYLSQNDKYKIIGFIDDDKKIKNFRIFGIKVLGNQRKIKKLKKEYKNILVIMAMINISYKQRRKIISELEEYEVNVKTIPKNYGALKKELSIDNFDLDDLIDRETSLPDQGLLEKNIKEKSILITGAGGSIGSEICRQVINMSPSKLICIDSSEFNLFRLRESISHYENTKIIKYILRDIKDIEDIDKIIKDEEIENIYHCAAYKHVPLLQEKENFKAAVENNFFATYDLCHLALKNKVKFFTLISSDKAVNPTNLMGATKRLAELSLQAFQKEANNASCFAIVRFGNVLNSSGSVVPTFWDQILAGGPVTVTHQDINRFFMTIDEASQLVIQASSLSSGGEVFLLDMGDPIRILDLARKMIRLSGNSVSNDNSKEGIEITFSGLRPGEKLYEELLLSKNPMNTKHPRIKKGMEKSYEKNKILNLKNQLHTMINSNNLEKSNMLISEYVDGYVIDI